MPKVVFLNEGRRAEVRAGTTVLEAADALGVKIGRVCGGQGTCSTCRVQVAAGAENLSPADENEIAYQLGDGVRLACQARVEGDVGATLPPRPPRTGPRNLGRTPPPRIFLPGEGEDAGPVDFAAVFGRTAPVEMEIGVGKGRFLLAAAAARPDRDFFGAEIEPEYAAIVRLRAARLGLANVRCERLDGKAFVLKRLAPASLAALHVYFPDPWPKKRHHKRRLVDAEWAAASARALSPGGLLRVASDHAEYFAVMDDVLSAEPLLERLSASEEGEWSAGTSYEVKFVRCGRSIRKAVFRRRTP